MLTEEPRDLAWRRWIAELVAAAAIWAGLLVLFGSMVGGSPPHPAEPKPIDVRLVEIPPLRLHR